MCQKLTKDKDGDGEIDQWGVANANAFGFTPYVYGNGGQFLNDDQTKVVIDEIRILRMLSSIIRI